MLVDARNVQRSQWPNLPDEELVDRTRAWGRSTAPGRARLRRQGAGRRSSALNELDERTTLVGTGGESADDWLIREAPVYRGAWLVTSDRALRAGRRRHAERVIGGGSFLRELGRLSGREDRSRGRRARPAADRLGARSSRSTSGCSAATTRTSPCWARGSRAGRHWRAAGFALHAVNGAAFGLAFDELRRHVRRAAAQARGRHGPRRALTLYSLCYFIDRYHPARGEPGIPPLLENPRAFAQATWRHLLFGAVLGKARRLAAGPGRDEGRNVADLLPRSASRRTRACRRRRSRPWHAPGRSRAAASRDSARSGRPLRPP